MLSKYLQRSLNVIQNTKGDSPLHIACRESHLEVVQVLAEQFNVNRALKNEVGQTPLEIAKAQNAQAIIEALQSTKPLTDVEPPAKKPRLDEMRVTGLHSSQDQESRPVLSDHEEYTQPPSNTRSLAPPVSSTADSHATEIQNPRRRAEESPELPDPMEDESDEPSLSLSTSKCILLQHTYAYVPTACNYLSVYCYFHSCS